MRLAKESVTSRTKTTRSSTAIIMPNIGRAGQHEGMPPVPDTNALTPRRLLFRLIDRVGVFSALWQGCIFWFRTGLELHFAVPCVTRSGGTHRGGHREEFGKVEFWLHGKHGHQVTPLFGGEYHACSTYMGPQTPFCDLCLAKLGWLCTASVFLELRSCYFSTYYPK